MKELETNYRLKHWKLILAFCLTSIATISCSTSAEKNTARRPSPTPFPHPTQFPYYKFLPIPEVLTISDDSECASRFALSSFSFAPTSHWPFPESLEITPDISRPKPETSALVIPPNPKTKILVELGDDDVLTNYWYSPACNPDRILAQLIDPNSKGHHNTDVFLVNFDPDLNSGKYLTKQRFGLRAEKTLELVTVFRLEENGQLTRIPMQIVP